MFSNDRSIKPTFHYFYIVFYYYWFLEIQFNQYKLSLFLSLFIHQVFYFVIFIIILALFIVDLFFALVGSLLVDPETCSWVWFQISCRPYPNWTYRFASPTVLWKVVVRVMVGCSDLFSSIDLFSWYKIPFKLFV